MSKKVTIVMPYYDRQIQLNKTLETMCLSKHDNFSVVIVDDGSPVKVVLPELPFPVEVLRLGNEICTNVAPVFNAGIAHALLDNPDIIIIQSPECYHAGDVISHASGVTNREYITFGCFRLDIETTFRDHDINEIIKNPSSPPAVGIGDGGINAWYNHPVHSPNAFYWCAAITADNMIKLNGIEESFSFGYGQEDGYFIDQIKLLELDIKITEHPFVVHQWHSQKCHLERLDMLVMRNRIVYESLIQKQNYRANHILTNDFIYGE